MKAEAFKNFISTIDIQKYAHKLKGQEFNSSLCIISTLHSTAIQITFTAISMIRRSKEVEGTGKLNTLISKNYSATQDYFSNN